MTDPILSIYGSYQGKPKLAYTGFASRAVLIFYRDDAGVIRRKHVTETLGWAKVYVLRETMIPIP